MRVSWLRLPTGGETWVTFNRNDYFELLGFLRKSGLLAQLGFRIRCQCGRRQSSWGQSGAGSVRMACREGAKTGA